MASAFFYGTLMHPKILKRVIGNEGNHLEICPAILSGYTRHNVKSADYPAIIPYELSKTMVQRELTADEKSVRGTLVAGLTDADMRLLDVFEGDEYTRDDVSVHPLAAFAPLSVHTTPAVESAFVPATPAPLPDAAQLAETVDAQTYVWAQPLTQLHPELWSYETFVRDNAWKWIGDGANSNKDYLAVDEVRPVEDVRWEGRD